MQNEYNRTEILNREDKLLDTLNQFKFTRN